MDFINIGGGELLVIILLAIVLFGPEDILKIMRTLGEYVRKIRLMWAQVSTNLSGEFITDDIIPEEYRETLRETQESVAALKNTLTDIGASAKAELDETTTIVEGVGTSLKEISASVAATVEEAPKALEATLNAPAPQSTLATAPLEPRPAPGADSPVEKPHHVTPVEDDDALAHAVDIPLSEAPITNTSAEVSGADVPLTTPPLPTPAETYTQGEDR
jgi:sec-independent protein translocase protein TatB